MTDKVQKPSDFELDGCNMYFAWVNVIFWLGIAKCISHWGAQSYAAYPFDGPLIWFVSKTNPNRLETGCRSQTFRVWNYRYFSRFGNFGFFPVSAELSPFRILCPQRAGTIIIGPRRPCFVRGEESSERLQGENIRKGLCRWAQKRLAIWYIVLLRTVWCASRHCSDQKEHFSLRCKIVYNLGHSPLQILNYQPFRGTCCLGTLLLWRRRQQGTLHNIQWGYTASLPKHRSSYISTTNYTLSFKYVKGNSCAERTTYIYAVNVEVRISGAGSPFSHDS
jgi:hypothetical protein